jgi:hypothetical protein
MTENESRNSEKEEPLVRLQRTALSVRTLAEQDDDAVYWASRTPEERMMALEYLRRMAYGPAALAPLQRVLSVVSLDDL